MLACDIAFSHAVSRLHKFLFVVLVSGTIKAWHWSTKTFKWEGLDDLSLASVKNKAAEGSAQRKVRDNLR